MKIVFKKPILSEKSLILSETGKFVFLVNNDATKHTVKRAVEEQFKVTVTSVNMINILGKAKSFRRIKGKRSDIKKAVVTLKKGEKIALFEGVKS